MCGIQQLLKHYVLGTAVFHKWIIWGSFVSAFVRFHEKFQYTMEAKLQIVRGVLSAFKG